MTTPHPQRVVDMRIPLPYLISAVAISIGALGSTLWTVAGQSNDLKLLVVASAKMEKRMEEGVAKADTRIEETRDRFSNVDRTTDNLKLRVDALERAGRK
jgi:hypothetical protein